MKIYAISDIHGYLPEFETALSKIDLSSDNKLILLGDYIHGPDSYGVLNKIMRLQKQYGTDKVIALRGNHEEMALDGSWPIGENRFGFAQENYNINDDIYLSWFSTLPYYYTVGNTIFVHAGIDEEYASLGLWEEFTDQKTFVGKFPAETGKIDNFNMKIIAGHIGTNKISGNPHYHDIYFDGGNHYYIDGTVQKSGAIPLLMYDGEKDKYYRITDSGEWLILPYNQEN